MDIFERFPLALFSAYTQVQCQILESQRNRVLDDLDLAFPLEGSVHGPSLNEAYGNFWLWTLGAYEVARTMAQHRHCFSSNYADQLVQTRKRLAIYRVPFAKQELQGKAGSSLIAEASIGTIDIKKRDFAFIVGSERFWVRDEMSAFGDLLAAASLREVLHPIHAPKPVQSGA